MLQFNLVLSPAVAVSELHQASLVVVTQIIAYLVYCMSSLSVIIIETH